MTPFPCAQCGLCCQHVHLAAETQYLDRGDGTCKHYASATKSCSIYLERPNICRVDLQFQTKYIKLYTWEEFVEANRRACQVLLESVTQS
ncbi:YkgJ family cysteine cluster protein [Delftia sp. BR1]|nr:YkgJ family cysteine cluster protein [Delftia sp. BR1]